MNFILQRLPELSRRVRYRGCVSSLAVAGALYLGLHANLVFAEEPGIALRFSERGLASLTYHGQEFLDSAGKEPRGEPVMSVWLEGDPKQHYDGPKESRWPDPNTFVRLYPWGLATVHYGVAGDNLNVTVEVHNTSAQQVRKAQCDLFYLRFPDGLTPDRWDNTDPPKNDGRLAPTVLTASYRQGKLVTVDPDPGVATYTRFGSRQGAGYQLSLASLAPLAPGQTVRLSTSCRFRPPDAPVEQVAADVYHRFRDQHPRSSQWADRRPIGSLMLARVNTKWATNPRGWLNDPSLDVFTPNRRAVFWERLFAFVNATVTNLRMMDAQGVIVWDLEGEQFPQGEATYAGDPRLLPKLAPEMEPVADALFEKFKRAGLRVGVCLRADAVTFRPNGSFYQKVFMDRQLLLQSLDDRIAYAKARWGCTIYYIDSFGGPPAYDPDVLRQLAEKHPDVLLVPEFEQTLTYAYAAPYKELRPMGRNPGTGSTPSRVTAVYPDAFSVINVADGDLPGRRAELLQAVRRGDVLLFRAWYRNQEFAMVRTITQEARATSGREPVHGRPVSGNPGPVGR